MKANTKKGLNVNKHGTSLSYCSCHRCKLTPCTLCFVKACNDLMTHTQSERFYGIWVIKVSEKCSVGSFTNSRGIKSLLSLCAPLVLIQLKKLRMSCWKCLILSLKKQIFYTGWTGRCTGTDLFLKTRSLLYSFRPCGSALLAWKWAPVVDPKPANIKKNVKSLSDSDGQFEMFNVMCYSHLVVRKQSRKKNWFP